jgi:predicted RND superfamily exporter protein
MQGFFDKMLKIRWLIILFVVITTVFLAIQIPDIQVNSDVISSLPDTDRDAALLKKIGAKFGGNKTGIIILESENIFTREVLEHVKQLTDTLTETEGVSSVTSLTSIMDIKADEN